MRLTYVDLKEVDLLDVFLHNYNIILLVNFKLELMGRVKSYILIILILLHISFCLGCALVIQSILLFFFQIY